MWGIYQIVTSDEIDHIYFQAFSRFFAQTVSLAITTKCDDDLNIKTGLISLKKPNISGPGIDF